MQYLCFEQIVDDRKVPRIIEIGNGMTLAEAAAEVPKGTEYHVLHEEAKQAFWGNYQPAVVRARRNDELLAKLDLVDRQSIRPLRAIAEGRATDLDRQRLAELEAEAEKLREELAGL